MSFLHIEIIGKGFPLILLHGWGFDSSIWQPLVPKLKENYQLFLIDLPGFGHSDPLAVNYTLEHIATELLAKTPENANWLGWSLGGLIASWIAIHFPHRVNKLISVASTPRFVSDHDWPGTSEETLIQFSEKLTQSPSQTLHDFLMLQLRGSPCQDEILLALKNKISQSMPSAETLRDSLKLLCNIDLRKAFLTINCPCLFIFGQLDTIVPARVAPLIPGLIKESQCKVFKRTGHMPFLTHSELFLKALNQFLS